MIMTHQTACTKLRQLQFLITLIINLTSSLRAQLFVNTESSLKLEMSPMIQWVAECIRNSFSPLLELLPIACIGTSAETLIYTISSHGTPLVVVTTEPKFCNTLKLVIISYHLWNKVAVIVNNWHFSRMIVEKILRSLSVEQEIFIHKLLHNCIVVFNVLPLKYLLGIPLTIFFAKITQIFGKTK